MKTQVGIIGAGPAGLLLSHLLHLRNIESVVLENRSQGYIENRVRAGVLEQGSVDLLNRSGLGERMQKQGLQHHGIELRFDQQCHRIDFDELTDGKGITVYGQQELVKDLVATRLAAGGEILFEADAVKICDIDRQRPRIEFRTEGVTQELTCDYVVGCDGFHGISRPSLPAAIAKTFERNYPFAWLGILVAAPPSSAELIYANSPRGFALHSMRSPTITRNYVQCKQDDGVEDWSDDRIWHELQQRLGRGDDWQLQEGKILEKSITPMRSFVCETMHYEKLFLAGDAAHIVPPTGAKGLNLAIADVDVLSTALAHRYQHNDEKLLATYSSTCLRRVWRSEHFSWWMTSLLHKFSDHDDFQRRLQLSELHYICNSPAAAATLAENYVGFTQP